MSSRSFIKIPARLKKVWPLLFFILCAVQTMAAANAFDRFTAHGGPVRDLALSPDGSQFVSASFDYSAVL